MPATIVQSGQINTTALTVPGAVIQIQPPSTAVTGSPSNIVGAVGVGSWGPVNAPVLVGTPQQLQGALGSPLIRKYDLATMVLAAMQQGANNFKLVRVTDGTDVAAAIQVLTTCILFTAKYTGIIGNGITVAVAVGSLPNTFKATVSLPGQTPEMFDNIVGSGNALWVNMAAAINAGIAGVRGKSRFIVASAGAGTTAPATASYPLTGGTDGASGVTATTLVGNPASTPRSGMYALTGTGISKFALTDSDTSSSWPAQSAFAAQQGAYCIGAGPAGDTIANAATVLAGTGAASSWFKMLFGDWILWADPVNQITRLISPQAFALGAYANMDPQESGLNYQLNGIVGSQSSQARLPYAPSDIQALVAAGIDVIANPSPGGDYWALQTGNNTSSSVSVQGDNYTMMTDYLAQSFGAVGGKFIGFGNLQTIQKDDPWRRKTKAAFDAFLASLKKANPPQIDSFSTICDLTNNTPEQIGLGYAQINIAVRYLSVVRFFIVNLLGGQGVTVAVVQNPQA